MDDYDPMDAFMEANEEQRVEDDRQWESEVAGFRMNMKRNFSSSITIDPQEALVQGLQRPIPSSSFGMKMLQRMGFKPGDGLGKNGEGIKEPVEIKLKYDKVGIGHEMEVQRQKKEEEEERKIRALREELSFNMRKQQYDRYVRGKMERKNIMRDLRQAQEAIEMLDEQNEKPRNPLLLGDDDDCDLDTLDLHLRKMIGYLRATYSYCIYCGCSYNDENDLIANCPGVSREEH